MVVSAEAAIRKTIAALTKTGCAMVREQITAYYEALNWGTHINMFSVLMLYVCGDEIGGKQLRERVFFPGSPMNEGPMPDDATQRNVASHRHRQILYHAINAKKQGYLAHVHGTHSKATRYTITDMGRAFVESALKERENFMRMYPGRTIAQACDYLESKRIAKFFHFSVKSQERKMQNNWGLNYDVNEGSLTLQMVWGIKQPSNDSSIPKRLLRLINAEEEMGEEKGYMQAYA